MGRRLSRADDASDLFTRFRVRFGPRMDHEHDDITDHADGMPALFVRMWIQPGRGQWIVEHEPRSLEAEAVGQPVPAALVRVPSPAQITVSL